MEYLIALANAGVKIHFYGPGAVTSQWYIKLEKQDAGVALSIVEQGNDSNDIISAAYAKWERLTKSIPTHNLKQIEAPAKTIDDEIPF